MLGPPALVGDRVGRVCRQSGGAKSERDRAGAGCGRSSRPAPTTTRTVSMRAARSTGPPTQQPVAYSCMHPQKPLTGAVAGVDCADDKTGASVAAGVGAVVAGAEAVLHPGRVAADLVAPPAGSTKAEQGGRGRARGGSSSGAEAGAGQLAARCVGVKGVSQGGRPGGSPAAAGKVPGLVAEGRDVQPGGLTRPTHKSERAVALQCIRIQCV